MKRILAFDIGGTGLKAAVIDPRGRFLTEKARIPTPHPCPPKLMVAALTGLARPLGAFDCATIGFPGFVRGGVVHTAPWERRIGRVMRWKGRWRSRCAFRRSC